jgi:hypothetical protein
MIFGKDSQQSLISDKRLAGVAATKVKALTKSGDIQVCVRQ